MKQTFSLFCALAAAFLWGTTFVAQDQGMDHIGPLAFNGARFFFGFLALFPLAFIFELRHSKNQIILNRSIVLNLIGVGVFLFCGTILQQYALLYTDVANAAFFTIFYVLIVPFLALFLYSKAIHWSVWPSIFACILGGYFLSDFSNSNVRIGDSLVILCALFWSLHIVYVSRTLSVFNYPFLIASIQCLIVAFISGLFTLIFEEISINNLGMEISEILYAGVLSSGLAFLLQIYAQRFISPAPVAIIFSLEGVFGATSAWILLQQILRFDQIIGCFLILLAIMVSQVFPLLSSKRNYK